VRVAVAGVELVGLRVVLSREAIRPVLVPLSEKTDVTSLIDPENPILLVAVILAWAVAPVVR